MDSDELDMMRFSEFLADRHPELMGDEDKMLLAWQTGFHDAEYMEWQKRKYDHE